MQGKWKVRRKEAINKVVRGGKVRRRVLEREICEVMWFNVKYWKEENNNKRTTATWHAEFILSTLCHISTYYYYY